MRITYVCGECAPFATSGGLGEVMATLPGAVKKANPDADVSVILPYYDTIRERYENKTKKVCDLIFNLSWRSTGCSVFEIEDNGIAYYFIENHRYFDRGVLYGESDDVERFAFFGKAVLEFMLTGDKVPDVLHANDWQSASSVIYLKTLYKNVDKLSKMRTVYTIHNIEYQGKYNLYGLGDILGLSDFDKNYVEYDGNLNLMKGAITLSDYISTVSPNYKDELKYDFFAFGLAPIINSVTHKMCGIINGIDYDYFSPQKDKDIYFPYNKDNVKDGKKANKLQLQREFGLPVSENTPMLSVVTRLTETKGIDLILHVIEELLNTDIQIVVLGSGEERYENEFIRLSNKYENMISVIKFDRTLSKKIYAASDIFLMPSKSEPCGLSQMVACSYGAVPIVRSVGGLYDTIINWTESNGNGFRFDDYNAHEFLYTIKTALSVYGSEKWREIQYNAMNSKFEWSNSAEKYISVYNNLLSW